MRKHSSMFFGLLAVVLALVMIGATVLTAGAASGTLSQEEIDKIVNTTTDASQITSPFTEVVNQVRNSVVGVNNYATTSSYYGYGFGFGYGQPETRESLQGTGSGVVISEYGHVLTNYHVVEGATRVTVTTALDEDEHEATVVGYDADLDIAVLEVKGLNVPAVPLGDSDQLQVGEWAIVIGNPIGEKYSRSVTVGAISGLNREVTDRTTDRYGRMTTITNTMIQTDAAINSGNSGGGMFNTLGQLQGIPARYANSTSYYSSGRTVDNIGLCIPINVAKPLITEVLRDYNSNGKQAASTETEKQSADKNDSPLYGKPRLGVTYTFISNATQYGLPTGALIRSVDELSPASEGGIQAGDIIVEIEGTLINAQNALTDKLAEYKTGDTITVKVYRDEALASQMDQNRWDMTDVGNGTYVDLTVTLRVVDNMQS
ncbi:MAG: trypsin-like peptidase domain-containing protein [Clostridia bacterium]|nr:trypsin-like peptidase domain-containing protein [Clostridia bacterium]